MKKYPYVEILPVVRYQYAVCFTLKQLQQLSPRSSEFMTPDSSGCVRICHGGSSIMCVDLTQVRSTAELINTLAHESTHIWQAICEYIGEEAPGDETSAYHIGHITQKAYEWYEDHMKKTKKEEEKTSDKDTD